MKDIIHIPELSITRKLFLEIYRKNFLEAPTKQQENMDFKNRLKKVIKESIEYGKPTKQYVLAMIENAFDSIQKDDIIFSESNDSIDFIITMPQNEDESDIKAGIIALEHEDILGGKISIERVSPRVLKLSILRLMN